MSPRNPTITSPTLVVDADNRPESIRIRKTKLLIISGPMQGREFVLDRDVFSIGSGSQNDLRLEDPAVSKRHCEIRIDEIGYAIQDLGSTNGTYVQGIRVSHAFLHPGAELTLGKTRLVFCPLQEAQELSLSPHDS